jgi:hypothetical protein
VDSVCCDNACTGACLSCATSASPGKCSPYAAGTDPQNECGKGTGLCRSTCDGVGACVFPGSSQPCASCTVCNGAGTCSVYDPYCTFAGGGAGGGFGGSGGTGGTIPVRGGAGGSGGFGGTITVRGGAGGSGGYVTNFGGSAGTITVRGGAGGSGGYVTSFGGSAGTITVRGGAGGSGGTIVRGGAGGSGGYVTTVGGAGGYVNLGGSGGYFTSLGGAGGKPDGGTLKDSGHSFLPDGAPAITTAHLRRSGCYCELGNARQPSGLGLMAPLVAFGLVVGLRIRRRRR